MSSKRGIVLVNMGGPSDIAEVKPFLTAILEDPYILGMPALLRIPLSRLIVAIRLKKVIERYRLIGGGSPLAMWSEKLIDALTLEFSTGANEPFRLAYAFRYCSPTIQECLQSFKSEGVEEVTLLPLFPHYTRAMTGSISVVAQVESKKLGLRLAEIPVWGEDETLLNLQKDYLYQAVQTAGQSARVLFVAHGIPVSDVLKGDTYGEQVERTANALGKTLPAGIKWSLCYSSRLGPVKWLEPYLEDELQRLGQSTEPLVIMQVSFVFDCLETLYDLDIVATKTAREMGISQVFRVPSFNDDPRFVKVIHGILQEADRV